MENSSLPPHSTHPLFSKSWFWTASLTFTEILTEGTLVLFEFISKAQQKYCSNCPSCIWSQFVVKWLHVQGHIQAPEAKPFTIWMTKGWEWMSDNIQYCHSFILSAQASLHQVIRYVYSFAWSPSADLIFASFHCAGVSCHFSVCVIFYMCHNCTDQHN